MKHLLLMAKGMVILSFVLLFYNGIVWFLATQILYKDIDNLANDAIEMTMDDTHRSDHISKLDPDAFQDNFDYLVIQKYGLDSSFRATKPGLIEKELIFTDVDIAPGEYAYDEENEVLKIVEEPQINIKGYTEKKVEVLFFSAYAPIKFNVIVDNTRVD